MSPLAANVALLAAILVHNLTYPLSAAGGPWPALFYLYYGLIFVAGTWLLARNQSLRLLAASSGGAVIMAGLANSYAPSSQAALAVFLTSIAYHLLMGIVLASHTFRARAVTSDILLSATSLYLVIGSGFAALLSLVEWLAPGSYAAGDGNPVTWQQLVYFSYVTLTTLGYGDILPVGFYAQALATFEAIIGTLYTVILLSRLVGLYSTEPASVTRE